MKKTYLFAALAGLITFTACNSEEPVSPEPPQQEETTVEPTEEPKEDPKEKPEEEPGTGEEDIFKAEDAPRKAINLGAAQQEISREMNKFAWKMFSKTFENKEEANLMASPYSLLQDLLMLSNGVQGETLAEIMTALGIDEFSMDEVNQYILQFNEGMVEADPRTRYRTDNSVWYQNHLTMQHHFAEKIAQYYKAETFPATMSGATLDSINNWTDERTYGRIPRLLDNLDPATQAVLINTVYFRGLWELQPEEKDIEDGIFHNENGQEEPARMIPYHLGSPYIEGETYQATSRNFGNRAYAMDFILPKEGVAAQEALAEYVDKLDEPRREPMVKLFFPRFETESVMRLNDVLHSMGINRMFGIGSSDDFQLFNESSFVSNVMQKTSITVDEKGTEAAAATYTGLDGEGPGDPTPEIKWITMTLDRPFFYAIRETSTNTPLFIGYQGSVAK